MPFRHIIRETNKLLGFEGVGDLLGSALGVKLYPTAVLKFLTLGTVLAGATAFCTRWIWEPPSALFLLLFLDLANSRYGYLVAKKLRGERFSWPEFHRLGGIMISTIIVMAVVRNAINAYPYYDFLADLVFGWLFTTKAQKVVSKMVVLKVQEQGAANLFQYALNWLLNSKLGPVLVDSLQPPRAAATEAEAPATPEPMPQTPAEQP